MKKPTYGLNWLKRNAFFLCQDDMCAEETSFFAHMLRIHPSNGLPICEGCWIEECENEHEMKNLADWRELKPFDPFGFIMPFGLTAEQPKED